MPAALRLTLSLLVAALVALVLGAPRRYPAQTQPVPAPAGFASTQPLDRPKNVILMIADGAGYNTLLATRYWTGHALTTDGEAWLKLALATDSLRGSRKSARGVGPLEQDPQYVYHPQRYYDTAPLTGGDGGSTAAMFAGYERHRRTCPDSAATMSAMMTGQRTYNGAINVDGAGRPLTSVPELAQRAGKRVGSISTVAFPHATVAAGAGAHHVDRGSYGPLAHEMLTGGVADVIAGAGHPEYDDNGRPRPTGEASHLYVDQSDWQAVRDGTLAAHAEGRRWTLVEDRAQIAALASGDAPPKLLIVPKVHRAFQQKRSATGRSGAGDARRAAPGEHAPLADMPTLAEVSRAALNALDDDPDGFFLMIEGGAVDWAMHAHQLGRMIEEYVDFDQAVRAVCDYLDADTNGNNWSNTLVIVTADHDHLLFGPEADRVPFQDVTDNGAGKLPGHRWIVDSHSAQPVPLFARGHGAERLIPLADQIDRHTAGRRTFGRGAYLHQAELGQLLKELVGQGDGAVP